MRLRNSPFESRLSPESGSVSSSVAMPYFRLSSCISRTSCGSFTFQRKITSETIMSPLMAEKKGRVAHQGVFRLARAEDGPEAEDDYAARRAHEVYDGVGLAAQGLDSDVRHQRHGRRAEGRHADEHAQEHRDEEYERAVIVRRRRRGVGLAGRDDVVRVLLVLHGDGRELLARELLLDNELLAVRGRGGEISVPERLLRRGIVHRHGRERSELHIVREAEHDEERRRADCAGHDEGRAPAAATPALVRERPEE